MMRFYPSEAVPPPPYARVPSQGGLCRALHPCRRVSASGLGSACGHAEDGAGAKLERSRDA